MNTFFVRLTPRGSLQWNILFYTKTICALGEGVRREKAEVHNIQHSLKCNTDSKITDLN